MHRFAVVLASMLLSTSVGSAFAEPIADETRALDLLVELTLERIDTADAVAAAKWGTSAPIDDPAREAQVYDTVADLGAARDVPPELVRSVFFGQIEANKIVQRGLYAWWTVNPSAAPSMRPDLANVRPVIDRLNVALVDEVAAQQDPLTGPDCQLDVAAAIFNATTTSGADVLHQAALLRAAATFCVP